MEKLTFEEKVNSIKQDTSKTFKVTPWEIANHFNYHRRSWRLADIVNTFLNNNDLELSDDFYYTYFYSEMILRHKKIATTKTVINPIKRVDSMAAACHKPIYVDRNEPLAHAITLMQQNDYSQLPVVSGGERKLCGYISWKTIGLALWHGKNGDTVGDYLSPHVTTIPKNTPLLEAIQVMASKEFIIVLNVDQTFSGIITSADIVDEFFSITQAEAFLLLEQIELQIRILIDRAEIPLDELKTICQEENREVECIDDLTFGEYSHILKNPKYWDRLKIKNERADFVKFMENINKIRNKVMHFEPDGIGSDKMQDLRNMARYLSEIADLAE